MDVWWFPPISHVKIWIIQLKQPQRTGCLEFQVYIYIYILKTNKTSSFFPILLSPKNGWHFLNSSVRWTPSSSVAGRLQKKGYKDDFRQNRPATSITSPPQNVGKLASLWFFYLNFSRYWPPFFILFPLGWVELRQNCDKTNFPSCWTNRSIFFVVECRWFEAFSIFEARNMLVDGIGWWICWFL